MAIYEKLIVTDAGRRLLEKVYLNNKVEFTKMTTFEKVNYEEPIQDILVSSFSFDNSNKVLNVTACLTNRDLTDGYYLNSVGLYANDPDEGEILFAYINAVRADYITAFDSKIGETVLDITFSIKISATDNFQVVIPEQAYALANHEHFVKDIKFENNDVRLDNYLETMDNSVSKNTKDIEQIKEQGVQVADTLPIGSIIMWDDEQPLPESWEYVDDVDSDIVCRPNLLVNSDFESGIINQKGIYKQTITQVGGKYHYFIDGWRTWVESGMSFTYEILEKSIQITPSGYPSHAVMQQVLENLKIGKKYTVAVKLNGTIQTLTFEAGTYLKNDYLAYNPTNSTVSVILKNGMITEVGFIKSEEGAVFTGMPIWRKETELIPCWRAYQELYRIPIYATNSSGLTYFVTGDFFIPMKKTPSCVFLEVLNQNAVSQDITVVNIAVNSRKIINITLNKTIGQYGYITVIADANNY